jgi:chemotaxis protein histidine kinase CheA
MSASGSDGTARNGAPGDILAGLRERFRRDLEERIITLESARVRLERTGGDAVAMELIRRECHKLSGIAGSFGFDEIGDRATDIDMAFVRGQALWPAIDGELDALLDAMEQELL